MSDDRNEKFISAAHEILALQRRYGFEKSGQKTKRQSEVRKIIENKILEEK